MLRRLGLRSTALPTSLSTQARRAIALAAFTTLAGLAGCGDDGNGNDTGSTAGNASTTPITPTGPTTPTTPATTTANVRAVHASPDVGAVDVIVGGASAAQGLAYGATSSFATIASGNTRVQVNPAGSATSALDAVLALNAGRDITILAVGRATGTTDAQKLQVLVIEDAGAAAAAGRVKLRVVHGTPDAPPVDIYLTGPTDALPNTPTIANLAFRQSSPASGQAALDYPAGAARVRIVVAGDTTRTIVYDSGSINLAAGSDLLLAAITRGLGASPIALLALPKVGAATQLSDSRSQVRFGNFSTDSGVVEATFFEKNRLITPLTFANLEFGSLTSGFDTIPPGEYRTSIVGGSDLKFEIAAFPTDADFIRLGAGSGDVFLIGRQNSVPPSLRLAQYPIDTSTAPPVAGKAKVRVIHLSPDAPAVDVAVLSATGVAGTKPVNNLAYPNATGYIEVPAGTLSLGLTLVGQTTPVLAPTQVSLQSGAFYTVIARGLAAPDGTPVLSLQAIRDGR